MAAGATSSDGLEGRVAFVAGATGPVGRAVVCELAARGARVAVHHRTGASAAADLAGQVDGIAVGADLSDEDDVRGAVDEVERSLGPVGVLVNAAHPRSDAHCPVAETVAATLTAQLDGTVGHAHLLRHLVPGMRRQEWGRIVYVSGALMARPAPGNGAYAAAKAAATVLTRYTALEEGRHGITANVVAPGRIVDPDAPEDLSPDRQVLADRLLERMAIPAFPSPAQVAHAVLGLLTAPYVTGQTLWVTGGEPIV